MNGKLSSQFAGDWTKTVLVVLVVGSEFYDEGLTLPPQSVCKREKERRQLMTTTKGGGSGTEKERGRRSELKILIGHSGHVKWPLFQSFNIVLVAPSSSKIWIWGEQDSDCPPRHRRRQVNGWNWKGIDFKAFIEPVRHRILLSSTRNNHYYFLQPSSHRRRCPSKTSGPL